MIMGASVFGPASPTNTDTGRDGSISTYDAQYEKQPSDFGIDSYVAQDRRLLSEHPYTASHNQGQSCHTIH